MLTKIMQPATWLSLPTYCGSLSPMRTWVVFLLVTSFLIGAVAWSFDIHIPAAASAAVVSIDHPGADATNFDQLDVHAGHCDHCTAHFTGLPVPTLATALPAAHPDWALNSIVQPSLLHTPPTPPPDR